MSATPATTARRLPVRTPAKARPRLIVVASPRSVGKAPFVALVGGLLLAGLLSLLMLHTLAAQDSFRQTSLQQRLANLTDVQQHLEQQVQLDSAPASLRAKARALGMVPSVITHYRQLPNGRTIAHEVAAPLVTAPVVSTRAVDAATDDAANQATNDATNEATNAAKNDTPKKDAVQGHRAESSDTKSSESTTHGHHGAFNR
jgi:hypothetical protein